MIIRPKFRSAALVGALAAVTATAWATGEAVSNSTYVPAPAVAVTESLAPNEAVVTVDESTSAPVVERGTIAQPAITVEQRRLSEDERIQAVVMDKLANNPRLSGKIGVESRDSVVRLTGYTRTVGQAWHAEREARGVVGVKYVQNEIRPRVGGSI